VITTCAAVLLHSVGTVPLTGIQPGALQSGTIVDLSYLPVVLVNSGVAEMNAPPAKKHLQGWVMYNGADMAAVDPLIEPSHCGHSGSGLLEL
jgi:hypothetical protein